MKNFIVYTAKGQILRSGMCQDADLPLQGEFVIEGKADDSMQYVSNGKVVNMPPKPGEFYIFDYDKKQWVPDNTAADQSARGKRNALLSESDWTQLPDVPLQTKTQWAQYRQALRDITEQSGYPFEIIWPIKPE